ncbi:hypothetical protein HYH03_013195 [Edaphochlamys debaryana]|uniref:Cwf15/Cwc15 cell cycle control protein n=1 Tax=Edaphochlamys debaryana TaxID=47281 RepID=A0A836BT54_9CHLO|nr:hypothetical protein HYH03_013195 [Edaphochlamys debaryana]|eukprot:KAG2488201.1 hypothetical protein HYH03_013195 [Edaphochlamys debaryana]
MTTAHRPTWAPAVGGEEQGGMKFFKPSIQVSAKNLPGHTKLKFRQEGQSSLGEVMVKDLRAELEEKEKKHFQKKAGVPDAFEEERQRDLKLIESAPAEGQSKSLVPKAIDADDEDPESSESSSDDDDDDDEEALLLAELERIKKERAEEAAKKAKEEAEVAARAKEEELKTGNPLLGLAGGGEVSFNVKRRWDDDVVFKNQARGEPKQQKRFVNDTIRNDFHKRFLQRYIR